MSTTMTGGLGLRKTAITDTVGQMVSDMAANVDTLDRIWPVGSVYMSTAATNPSSFLGGTWEEIRGRFPVGYDGSSFSPVGGTGGQVTMGLVANGDDSDSSANRTAGLVNEGGADNGGYGGRVMVKANGYTGKVLPPYYVVHIWHRTA